MLSAHHSLSHSLAFLHSSFQLRESLKCFQFAFNFNLARCLCFDRALLAERCSVALRSPNELVRCVRVALAVRHLFRSCCIRSLVRVVLARVVCLSHYGSLWPLSRALCHCLLYERWLALSLSRLSCVVACVCVSVHVRACCCLCLCLCLCVWEANKYAKRNHRAGILVKRGWQRAATQRQPCKHHPLRVIFNCAIHTERTHRHTQAHKQTSVETKQGAG